jgi:hypothetical protein
VTPVCTSIPADGRRAARGVSGIGLVSPFG